MEEKGLTPVVGNAILDLVPEKCPKCGCTDKVVYGVRKFAVKAYIEDGSFSVEGVMGDDLDQITFFELQYWMCLECCGEFDLGGYEWVSKSQA